MDYLLSLPLRTATLWIHSCASAIPARRQTTPSSTRISRDVVNVLEAAKKNVFPRHNRKDGMQVPVQPGDIGDKFTSLFRTRMRDEYVLAARCTLREPLVPVWFEEIEFINSNELLALLTNHRKCCSG
ncbi:hypothetical protein F5141DRAFT_1110415 [Pisolithus sp. B1]|nr:hypothetical protein F5141DRAFT_1110415 [Pisolithus sp. B1]